MAEVNALWIIALKSFSGIAYPRVNAFNLMVTPV
jgi:hypothetical protein